MIKGLEKLAFLTSDDKKLLQNSERLYKQHARIEFEVLSTFEGNEMYCPEVVIKVWQSENEAGKYLNTKELIDRTKNVFNMLPDGMALRVRPVPYSKSHLENYTIDNVLADMEKYGLQQKDLVKLLDINKSTLNTLLNGGRELTKPHKAMFYYLFEFLRLSK